jgi:SHS family lactate transporter-like MFS transporter
MKMLDDLKVLDRDQRATFLAAVLGWTLDAFDFFLMVFVVRAVAHDFKTEVVNVTYAITLTLMCRPLGALVFGWLADRYGRKPVLMVDILLFSFFELATAFAPSLTVFLILRALFGFAMGGEWGIGASLVMETIPERSRGTVSGILQEGYPFGYLLASLVYLLVFDHFGWRAMFMVGVVPSLLVLYIRMGVKESPVWEQSGFRVNPPNLFASLRRHWRPFLYVVLLMTAFNVMSHGTQDMYPTFLQSLKLPTHTVSAISIAANVGAIIGGVTFGAWSQRVGRRRAILTALVLALPVIPLWAYSTVPFDLGLGAFLLQIAVQGAWGVVPAHLNELSPPELRGTFPGFAYQLGNLLAASTAQGQAIIAKAHHDNFSFALASVTAVAMAALFAITACGYENKGVAFGRAEAATR